MNSLRRSLPLTEVLRATSVRHFVASEPATDPVVTGVRLDSRRVRPGDLYVALPGSKVHGGRFAAAAVDLGAVAVLTDAEGAELASGVGVPVAVVDDPRAALADVAVVVAGSPSSHLSLFGITGTNGKTTTSILAEAGLRALGRHVGTIGTLGYRLDAETVVSDHSTVTTPEANDLQDVLATFVERGADDVVMEVSSHALALQRVRGLDFDVVGFVNLGRDHLDFHADLEDYFEAKAKLFAPGVAQHAVVVLADDHARRLAERIRAAGTPALTTIALPGSTDVADVHVRRVGPVAGAGTEVEVAGPWGERTFTLDLPGDHNGINAVLALTMLHAAGHDVDQVLPGLIHAQVPGRLQRVDLPGEAPTVFVDFAHTPQAIAEVTRVGEQFDRTVVVVGAGGDRDNAKRGPMGEAAASHADVVIITDDNPRSEDPAAIRDQVVLGAWHARQAASPGSRLARLALHDVEGRADAIRLALTVARPATPDHPGDVVLVLGKGHEQGQIVADRVLPFDDADVVRRTWDELQSRHSAQAEPQQ